MCEPRTSRTRPAPQAPRNFGPSRRATTSLRSQLPLIGKSGFAVPARGWRRVAAQNFEGGATGALCARDACARAGGGCGVVRSCWQAASYGLTLTSRSWGAQGSVRVGVAPPGWRGPRRRWVVAWGSLPVLFRHCSTVPLDCHAVPTWPTLTVQVIPEGARPVTAAHLQDLRHLRGEQRDPAPGDRPGHLRRPHPLSRPSRSAAWHAFRDGPACQVTPARTGPIPGWSRGRVSRPEG